MTMTIPDAGINALLVLFWCVLAHTGQMPRSEVVEYFRSLFRGKLQRTHSFAWTGLVWTVADLAAPELSRNEPCPCGSGKKYKKCCGNG